MWHPNIRDKDGIVSISILDEPGNNPSEYEPDGRWLPIYTVESIVLAVISMLRNPNTESPYNVVANHEYLFDRETYDTKVRQCTSQSVKYL